MLIFVYGGSASGKSEYAEERLCAISSREKYYIATMEDGSDESRRRIMRHRQLRSGKGFITLEQPRDIQNANAKGCALLECLTNLVANEMFRGGKIFPYKYVAEKIISGIDKLYKKLEALIVVSGDVFGGGTFYDEATLAYMKALAMANSYFTSKADEAVQVVCGIPVYMS